MTTGRTTLIGHEVTVYGFTITLDIDVEWTRDPGVWRRADGSGEPPSFDIDGFEIDEDQALVELLLAWADCDPTERPVDMALASEAEMKHQIAQAVANRVDMMDSDRFEDDGDMHADDREQEDDDGN